MDIDAEASKVLSQSFADTISKQRESAVAQAKRDLLNNTGNPGVGNGGIGEKKTEDVLMAEQIAGTMKLGGENSISVFENY